MVTEESLTFKEAIEQLEGFEPYLEPTKVKGENLGVDIIPIEKFQELSEKGAQLCIDKKDKYIFLRDNGKYFVYLGYLNPDSIMVSKENIIMGGLTIDQMARIMNMERAWSDKAYMERFKGRLRYHLDILEKAGLVERRLISISEYLASA